MENERSVESVGAEDTKVIECCEIMPEEVNAEDVESEKCESETVALKCFGWHNKRIDKWLVKCANVWYLIMSFLWFVFGAVTFAPVMFITNEVNVLFKSSKKSLAFGIILYVLIITAIILCAVTP